MVPVSEIWEEARSIVGNSRDDFLYRRITDSVELLANKGDFDPLVGYLDICVDDQLVALPRDVEVPTAVNMAGLPSVPRDRLFQFHLNGPGQWGPEIPWQWYDYGQACTYRDLPKPSKLLGWCTDQLDENSDLWIYGYDVNGNWIRSGLSGGLVDGWKVPVFRNQNAISDDAPIVKRITRVRKAETQGPVRLATVDNDDLTGTLLGIYQWDETDPSFRRIKLTTKVPWVTISYRKKVFKVRHQTDLLPVNNSQAVLMMLRALQHYKDSEFAEGEAAEATAVRWITEEQRTSSPPVIHPIQVHDKNPLVDPCDQLD